MWIIWSQDVHLLLYRKYSFFFHDERDHDGEHVVEDAYLLYDFSWQVACQGELVCL